MSLRYIHTATLLCALLAATQSPAADVIDRILATVNGHIVLQSDVEEAIAYQEFVDARPPAPVSADQRKAVLDQLIDQELIREEVHTSDFQPATPAEVEAKITDIKKIHPEVKDSASWLSALHRYGLTEGELREKITADLNSWKAVEARLRPSVAVDSRSIERYYQETLLPQLRRRGVPEVPIAEVSGQIKEVLAQRQINDLLANWLKSLRTESNIQMAFVPGVASEGGSH